MKPSESIDKLIVELADWRGQFLKDIRRLVHEAVPDVTEEWKYRGVPVWEHNGMIVIAAAFKNWVKITFPNGASLPDPDKLFNAELEGKMWRAINLNQGDKINETAFKKLIQAGAVFNDTKLKSKSAGKK